MNPCSASCATVAPRSVPTRFFLARYFLMILRSSFCETTLALPFEWFCKDCFGRAVYKFFFSGELFFKVLFSGGGLFFFLISGGLCFQILSGELSGGDFFRASSLSLSPSLPPSLSLSLSISLSLSLSLSLYIYIYIYIYRTVFLSFLH